MTPQALPRITVVGLGPSGADLVTTRTRELLSGPLPVFVRTWHHPAADELRRPGNPLAGARSFDDVYDTAETLEQVYATIVERLVDEAHVHGHIAYAVPGSPAVAERTVALLFQRSTGPGSNGLGSANPPGSDSPDSGEDSGRADSGGSALGDAALDVVVEAALSFVDLAWVRLGVDPLADGVRLVDGQRFATEAAGQRGPLLVAQCDTVAVLSEVKLAVDEPPRAPVVVLARLGLPDESITEVAWEDLDRVVDPDHLTSLYVPELAAPVAGSFVALTELMHTLRAECPWDAEQTHQSLVRHLVEETYEVVEAIEAIEALEATGSVEAAGSLDSLDSQRDERYEHLEEELGDLLFQVVFHSELATEAGRFRLDDVARTVHDKLHARHPHVFGDVTVQGAAGVEANWERLKQAEKQRASAMDGIPAGLPALLLALKSHERADRAGMAFPSVQSAWAKVSEELEELRADPGARELGDLLFATVGLAHELDIEPEGALRAATERFAARFRFVEAAAATAGSALSETDAATIDVWWEAAKAATADGVRPDPTTRK